MIAQVEMPDGSYRVVEAGDQECGRDFCDQCGDCLVCYGGDPCSEDGAHSWVIYKDDLRAIRLAASETAKERLGRGG